MILFKGLCKYVLCIFQFTEFYQVFFSFRIFLFNSFFISHFFDWTFTFLWFIKEKKNQFSILLLSPSFQNFIFSLEIIRNITHSFISISTKQTIESHLQCFCQRIEDHCQWVDTLWDAPNVRHISECVVCVD